MSQYFKLTYQRKQVTTDYLDDQPIREVTTLITEVIGGLPGSTVANYRKVLGDQVISVEPEEHSDVTPRLGSGRDDVRASRRSQTRKTLIGKAAAVATEDDSAMTGSYASLISKMAKKAAA